MSARNLYFRTLSKMTDGLAGLSDGMSGETFARLGGLFRLLDMRTAAGDEPTIDRTKSGFPILKEVVQVAKDLELGIVGVSEDREGLRAAGKALRDAMLDDMLLRRRLPDERTVRAVAQNIYASAVADNRIDPSRPGDISPIFQPNADHSFEWNGELEGGISVAWDFWDGTTSRAIRTFASFDVRREPDGSHGFLDGPVKAVREEIAEVRDVANKFSGASFTPLTLATEIDNRTDVLRLRKLSRVTVGPFISEIFYSVDDPIMDAIKAAEDIEDAWAIRWTIDHIRAGSTKMVSGGWLKPARPQQNFLVDTMDPDCAMRSVTSFERHVAMPHGMFQRLANRRHECPSLKSAAIHVLTGERRLIENT